MIYQTPLPNENIFVQPKPIALLLSLKLFNQREQQPHSAKLAKSIDSPICYIARLLKDFEKSGLIYSVKKGRIKCNTLTKRGFYVATELEKVSQKLREENGAQIRTADA